MSREVITTDRLTLRRARVSDVDDMHLVLSNPKAMRYWSNLPHSKWEQSGEFVEQMVSSGPPNSDEFVLEYGGQVIGKAGVWLGDEIGFILHPDYWGSGLATEALTAIIPHNFATLPVAQLKADVDPRNAASIQLLMKFGFVETGRAERTVQLGDEWCDSVYLELPRPK